MADRERARERRWSRRAWRWLLNRRLPQLVSSSMLSVLKRVARPPVGNLLWVLPNSKWMARKFGSPMKPWGDALPEIPEELLSVPGIRKDPALQEEAYAEHQLQNFVALHEESFIWEIGEDWASILPVAPLMGKAERAAKATWKVTPLPPLPPPDPQELTNDLRVHAASLGLGAIGVTTPNKYYTYAQAAGTEAGDRIVVCVLEQQHENTQEIAGLKGNLAGYQSESECIAAVAEVAEYLHSRGYEARAHTTFLTDLGMAISFAVDAGLGQMGLNGQLLTPSAGPRIRLGLLSTNAPLIYDEPQDFGIPGICDRCQACVQRCPVGAVRKNRKMFRGVEKAKINTARCFPTVSQAHGCGICIKVCPIQRYGLPSVLDHYRETGEILGKGSDELETYYWPLDDKNYKPGERPKIGVDFFDPPGFNFDVDRKFPKGQEPLSTATVDEERPE